MKILVVTGPPYSGKGTQCEILSGMLGFTHLSTGDRCRQEKMAQTPIGLILSEYEEKGDLVPDDLMKTLFSQIIDQHRNEKGIILDGYPRTRPQVDDLIQLAAEKQQVISHVINIDVPKDQLLARAIRRAATSTREDDKNPETHLKRVLVFEAATRPAIEYMKTRLPVIDIDGMGAIDEVTRRIIENIRL